MRYDNNKRFLKSMYKKYSDLDLSSTKKAVFLEKELRELKLKESKSRPISSEEYYKEKKRLLLEKKELIFLVERSKSFSEDFKFAIQASSHKELLEHLYYVCKKDRELDALYGFCKYTDKDKTI